MDTCIQTHIYNWIILLYTWNQHTVNLLYFHKIFKIVNIQKVMYKMYNMVTIINTEL